MSEIVVDKFVDPTNADYTMYPTDQVVRASSSTVALTITLPRVAECKGKIYTIMARAATGTYTITVTDQDDSESFGADKVMTADADFVCFYSDGISWILLASTLTS